MFMGLTEALRANSGSGFSAWKRKSYCFVLNLPRPELVRDMHPISARIQTLSYVRQAEIHTSLE